MKKNLEKKTKASSILNTFKKIKDWRRYEIPACHVAVIYQDNKFFKPEYYDEAVSTLGNGMNTTNFLRTNSKYLMSKAGVKDSTKNAFLWPGTNYILVPTDTQTYDPEPEEFLSSIKIKGEDFPLNVSFDMKINYELDPILYTLENAGKILTANLNWEQEFLTEIKTNADLGIAQHCLRGFPRILEPVSVKEIPGDQKRNLIKRGINIIDFVAIAHVPSEDIKQIWDFLSNEDKKILKQYVPETHE